MISREETQHIAKLARIKLAEEEIEKFQLELSKVLDYFEILKEVEVSSVEPMAYSVSVENVTREDEPKREDAKVVQKLLEMTPANQDGFVRVRSVFL